VVFAACVAIGCATAFLPEKSYRTSATIVLDINSDPDLGGGSVQVASFLLPAIEERAESTTMRELATADVPEEFQRVRVRIDAVSDASVLHIRGVSDSPRAAQAWVNAVADRLVEDNPATSPVILGVLDSAPLKRQPISPNVEPILAGFLVLGVILALFSTLAADRIQRAFDTNRAVRDRLGTTVLGELPVIRRRTERRLPVISLLEGRSASPTMVAAFETIRTNVDFRMTQAGTRNVVLIAASKDSNKGMITAGLAYSLAAAGRRVVAIEADLREPLLSTQLKVSPAEGLGDVFAFGIESLGVQPTAHPRLELVPAGLPAGRAADVVTSALPGVIDLLSNDSTTLVVNGPSLRGAPESGAVIAKLGYVVLTVNSGSTAHSDLSDAIDLVNDAGGTVLGVVVNGVSRRRITRHDGDRKPGAADRGGAIPANYVVTRPAKNGADTEGFDLDGHAFDPPMISPTDSAVANDDGVEVEPTGGDDRSVS
jgi:Mrp family chromosome partitioning ATPase